MTSQSPADPLSPETKTTTGEPVPRHSRYILRPPPISTNPAKSFWAAAGPDPTRRGKSKKNDAGDAGHDARIPSSPCRVKRLASACRSAGSKVWKLVKPCSALAGCPTVPAGRHGAVPAVGCANRKRERVHAVAALRRAPNRMQREMDSSESSHNAHPRGGKFFPPSTIPVKNLLSPTRTPCGAILILNSCTSAPRT